MHPPPLSKRQSQHKELAYRRILLCLLVVAFIMVSGCTVGPDFKRPEPPENASYTVDGLPQKTVQIDTPGGRVQVFKRVRQVRSDWYHLFHSQALNQLIKKALANNPSIKAGRQRLKAARANLKAVKGGLYPQINAGVGVSRQRKSGIQFGINNPLFTNVFNLYQGRISVGYHLDVFGGLRRRIEKKTAQLHFRQYQLLGTYLRLINNVVATSLAEAGINATIDAVKKIIEAQQGTLALLRKKAKYGAADRSQILQAKAQLAAIKARLPGLMKQRAIARNRLAVLTGQSPGEFQDPNFQLSELTLPQKLPVTLPSQLIRQRPDILAAQSLLHAASANIGLATAQLLPDFTLSASYARAALQPSALVEPLAALWSFGAALMAPLFHGGALRAHRQAAVNLYKAAAAEYRRTVLNALREVANSLASIQLDARGFRARVKAKEAAKRSLALARDRYRMGAIGYLALYTAQEQYQRALIAYIQARLQRFEDTVALFRSLGGGWWRPEQLQSASGATPQTHSHSGLSES